MADGNFQATLESWRGSKVTVINPESYTSSALREGLGFESYEATIAEVDSDQVKLNYTAQRKGQVVNVQQWIPIERIKRITLMGEDKLIHL
jgi:hypothetical protein